MYITKASAGMARGGRKENLLGRESDRKTLGKIDETECPFWLMGLVVRNIELQHLIWLRKLLFLGH